MEINMKKIAIIGAGISGLSTAHLLKDKYNITTKVVTDDYKGKNMICSRCKTLVAIIEKPKATRGYIVLPIVSAQC